MSSTLDEFDERERGARRRSIREEDADADADADLSFNEDLSFNDFSSTPLGSIREVGQSAHFKWQSDA